MDTKQALEEAPKLYAIVVTGTNGEMDADLAAAMEEVHEASLSNPDNFYNNPQKHREALEGLGLLLAERQEENGAFTDEELEPAMTIVLVDTGALIAVDRGRRDLLSRLQTAFENGDLIRAPAGVIGQVWRDGGRQTLLSRALNRCEEIPLDGRTA